MLIACTSYKGPAEQAIKAAEEAINATKAEAVKYVPDQVKSLESALAAVKDKFTKGDYEAAIKEAQSLVDKAKGVAEAAKAKKEELTKNWTDLSQGLPKMVEAIQNRVDVLSKSKKLPANLTAEKFAEAKSGLTAAKEEWAKALESFKSGNLTDAISVANSVKEKAVKTMEILRLSVATDAKS
jgi:HEPN domain-containing protein